VIWLTAAHLAVVLAQNSLTKLAKHGFPLAVVTHTVHRGAILHSSTFVTAERAIGNIAIACFFVMRTFCPARCEFVVLSLAGCQKLVSTIA